MTQMRSLGWSVVNEMGADWGGDVHWGGLGERRAGIGNGGGELIGECVRCQEWGRDGSATALLRG